MQWQLTTIVHTLVSESICSGDVVVDATAGNGNDSIFLAQCVEKNGKVFAFDIQQTSLNKTFNALRERGLESNVELCQVGHEHLLPTLSIYAGKIKAIIFNLGYCTGGDRQIATQSENTCTALQHSLELLSDDGVISILCYPGRHQGRTEFFAVKEFISKLDSRYSVLLMQLENTTKPYPPIAYFIRKRILSPRL